MTKGSKKKSGAGRTPKESTTRKSDSRSSASTVAAPTSKTRNVGEHQVPAIDPPTEPAAEEGVPGGRERIYAFADQLDQAKQKEGREVEEEHPESWVSFILGSQIYALPVGTVHEILRVGEITRVPHAPPAVLGVCNRRGRVLPVVDLRIRLGLQAAATTAASRIVVVSSDGRLLGLLVDSVRQVEGLFRSRVQPPPESFAGVAAGAVQGVVEQKGQMTVLLELASLLHIGTSSGEKIA